ncbi:hypothetical protein HYDPIDRAFT_70215, partial [Hydnomerulius pinastri MD-312]
LRCCSCSTAPAQLMTMGLFACAPLYPSLAVDLRVLELVKTLFVCIAPNTTAWTEALETFLDGCGYELKIKNSLWRCFSNAYHWYCVLIIQNDDHLSSLVDHAR